MGFANTRAALALQACQGITDEELQKRGPGSFLAMINRKRAYAQAARTLHAGGSIATQELAAAKKALAKAHDHIAELQKTIMDLEALDAPIESVDEAAAIIQGIIKKAG